MRHLFEFAFLFSFILLGNAKISYNGYKVYRFIPNTDEQREILLELQENNSGLNFWKEVQRVGQPVDIMFPPHLQGDLLENLLKRGYTSSEYVNNVQSLIDRESGNPGVHGTRKLDWNSYGSLADINEFLDEQVGLHPGTATLETIGKSFEGRDLRVLKISKPGNPNRRIIFIDANMHAREWITSAVCTWIINELLNSSDPDVVALTNDYDWYIMPMVNPDGFEYTKNFDRLWRKTRSETGSALGCKGADANKNFAFHWLEGGSSTNPCTDTFAGNQSFSEPETLAMSQLYTRISPKTEMYLSLHSYGQLILFPYGYTNARIPQYNEYMRIARAASEALALKFNTRFVYGNVVDETFIQSGSSLDWVKGVHNTNLTLWYELRDTGASGFVLPPDQIIPSSQEFLDSLLELVKQLRNGIAP
jgi:carboxypeptidase A